MDLFRSLHPSDSDDIYVLDVDGQEAEAKVARKDHPLRR